MDRMTDLHRRIEQDRNRPFHWGAMDCATWACRVFADVFSVPTDAYVPAHASRSDAVRLLCRAGSLGALAGAIAREHGLSQRTVQEARRGDIVLLKTSRRWPLDQALGICLGRVAIAPGQYRLETLPMSHALTAWGL